MVALTETGHRVGETHHNATIPEATIAEIRRLHEEEGWGYDRLARQFNIPKGTIGKICRYERRAAVPKQWKRAGPTSRPAAATSPERPG